MSEDRFKKRVWVFIGVLLGIALLYLVFFYPIRLNLDVNERLELEEQRLDNYIRLISQKPEKEAVLKQLKRKQEEYSNRLLVPDKPPVVAARLQNTLKEMASDEGLDIISEKQLPIIERGNFIEIPIEITLKCSITKLTNLIYEIEDYERFLDISKLSIRVINTRKPIDVRADLTVSGFILARNISEES